MKAFLLIVALFAACTAEAQQIKVEYDKKMDFTHYKTFRFGEGQITTPRDKRTIPDATIFGWFQKAITEELTEKGLVKSDSADLIVSYLTGISPRLEGGSVGPLGMTPGSTSQIYLRDFQQGTIVIDFNDTHNNKLIWRVTAITDSGDAEGDKVVDQVVEKGFRKFSIKSKKKK